MTIKQKLLEIFDLISEHSYSIKTELVMLKKERKKASNAIEIVEINKRIDKINEFYSESNQIKDCVKELKKDIDDLIIFIGKVDEKEIKNEYQESFSEETLRRLQKIKISINKETE